MTQAGFFYSRPVFVLLKLRKRYGNCFRMREPAYFGREWWIWVCDPSAIRELLAADGSVARPGIQEEHFEAAIVQAEGSGMSTPWEPFEGHDSRGTDIASIARCHVCQWPRGRPYRLLGPLRNVVTDILCATLIGVTDRRCVTEAAHALQRERRSDLLVHANLRHGDGGSRAARRLERERQAIAAALARARPDAVDAPWSSIAAVLAHACEVTTMWVAWALERLMRTKSALDALRDDLADGSDRYLDAVLAATLWIRPPVLSLGRRLLVDRAVCGFELPAGTMVRLAVGIAHFDAKVDARPEDFRPDHFLTRPSRAWHEVAFGYRGMDRLRGVAICTARAVLREVVEAVELERALEPPELSRFQRPSYVLRPNGATRAILMSRPRASGHEAASPVG